MRIKLDLSEFLEDERKFSVLKVKPKETKTVRDVISKIKHLFNICEEDEGDEQKRPRLGLFDEEFYIHPNETAAVLEDSGVLKLKSLPRPEVKGRKKKVKKEPVPVVTVEDEEEKCKLPRDKEEESGYVVVIKNDRKDSQSSPKEVVGAGEEHRKTSKKRKKSSQFGEEIEMQKRKRSRTEECQSTLEESSSREQHVKGRKKAEKCEDKRVKEKAITENLLPGPVGEGWKGKKKKQEQIHQASRVSCEGAISRKRSQQHVSQIEDWEVSEVERTEWKKQRLREDKGGGCSSSSQDKVVSTSSVLITTEGTSHARYSHTSDSTSDSDINLTDRKPCVADSVTDPLTSLSEEKPIKRKRKRKHKKKERSWKLDTNMSQANAGREEQNAWNSEAKRSVPSDKARPTTFSHTHIIFDSDDGDSIEVEVNKPCRQSKKNQHVHTNSDHDQREALLSSTIVGNVRDISRERRPPISSPSNRAQRVEDPSLLQNTKIEQSGTLYPEDYLSHTEKTTDLIHKRPVHNNLEELAKLRKICENNTITICKVDSRKDQPTKPKEKPQPSPPSLQRRGPPSPSHSTLQVVHDSNFSGSLQALNTMKNRSVPEVFSGVRAMGVRPIQRRSGVSSLATRPMASASFGKGNQSPTVLPDDDPLQILSSNLNEIQQQYKQSYEHTRTGKSSAALHSLGAIISNMKAKPTDHNSNSSETGHGKQYRTSSVCEKKQDNDPHNSDLLILGCIEGSVTKEATATKKGKESPDIYCVSPSTSSKSIPQASPSKSVSQTSPMKLPLLHTSPYKPMPQGSPLKPVQQSTMSRPVPQANLSTPLSLTKPTVAAFKASPSKPTPQTSAPNLFPQSILSKTLQQTMTSRSLGETSDQSVNKSPFASKKPIDEVVDLESDEHPEVVTFKRDDIKVTKVTALSPNTTGNSELGTTLNSSKKKNNIDTIDFSENRIDKNTESHSLNKPVSVSSRITNDGTSTSKCNSNQESHEIVLSDIVATSKQSKAAAPVHHESIKNKEEVMLDEDEVLVEDDEDEEKEEEALEEKEDEKYGVEEIVEEELQEDEQDIDIYANIDYDIDEDIYEEEEGEEEGEEYEEEEEYVEEEEEEKEKREEEVDEEEEQGEQERKSEEQQEDDEEEEEDHSDFDYEIIKEKCNFTSTELEEQQVQSAVSDSIRTTVRGDRIPGCNDIQDRGSSHNFTKTPDIDDEDEITQLVEESEITNTLTSPGETSRFITTPQKVVSVMSKSPDATAVSPSPESMTKSQKSLSILTEPEISSMAEKNRVTPVVSESEEIIPITSASSESQNARHILMESKEVIPTKINSREATNSMTKLHSSQSVVTESEKMICIEKESLKDSTVLRKNDDESIAIVESQEIPKTPQPNKPLDNSKEDENVSTVCQTTNTITAKSVRQENSVELEREPNKPDKDNYRAGNLSYHDLPPLRAPPKPGDIIAFKTMVMEECYSVTISDYQVAKVLAVNGVHVTLRFIETSNLQTLEAEELNGNDLEEDNCIREMDWRDIIGPRVIETFF